MQHMTSATSVAHSSVIRLHSRIPSMGKLDRGILSLATATSYSTTATATTAHFALLCTLLLLLFLLLIDAGSRWTRAAGCKDL